MYLQITTRCNMSCEHCCYSCGPQGDDMSLETFRQALDMCEEFGNTPFLGGGEPTIHPEFEKILLESIACAGRIGDGEAGIITNGKLKNRAMMIASLAKGNVIYAQLSRDIYHDPINMEVVYAFEALGRSGSYHHGIRDTSNSGEREPMPHGRGKEVVGFEEDEYSEDTRDSRDCPCEDWIIKPNGDIHQCGCEDAPKIGTVFEGVEHTYLGLCCRDPELRELLEEDDPDHSLLMQLP